MRLLSVINGATFGGAHNQAMTLASPLLDAGWETSVVLTDEEGDAASRLEAAGLSVTAVPMTRLRLNGSAVAVGRFGLDFAPQVHRLREVMLRERPDVVQVHGTLHPQAAIAARRMGAGVVLQLLDTRAPMPVRRVSMPLALRLADVFMSTGIAVGAAYPGTAALGDRLVPYVPPVDVHRFLRAATPGARLRARASLGVDPNALLVGAVGNRNPQKGYELLIDAVADLQTSIGNVDLRILGTVSGSHPGYAEALESRARGRGFPARAISAVPRGLSVADVLPAFDVMAVSSVPLSEGIPTVLIEAQAAGLPVVATRVGSVSEVVHDGFNGLVVEPCSVPALSRALQTVLGDPALRREMGTRGQARAKGEWTLDVCADAHVQAYGRAIGERNARRTGRGA